MTDKPNIKNRTKQTSIHFRQANFIIKKCLLIWVFKWQRRFTRKRLAKKAATIKRFEYLSLGGEFKKQIGIAEYQYKFFKEQINVNNDNRKYDIKKEDDEIDDVYHSYIGDEYNKFR